MQNPVPSKGPDSTWLTDIELIQAEIAKDLAMTGKASEEEPERPMPLAAHTPDSEVSIAAIPTPGELDELDELEESSVASYTAGFYRETIKQKSHNHSSWVKIVAVLVLICTFGMGSLGFGLGAAYTWFTSRNEIVSPLETMHNQDTPIITRNQYTFETGGQQTGTVADMIELLEPAVVSIITRFSENERESIAGSGTIFAENDDRIFIVTGMYVVPGIIGAQHHVRISGSRSMMARLVSTDRDIGLAVISLDKAQLIEAGIESFTIAEFGDSSQMQVGDVVFAMGNARNEGIAVTRGIISAGKQDLAFPEYTLTVLQTDAAINYGSSGGPLINLNGEVIGINIDRTTMIFGNAAVEGIGYSIASNVLSPVINRLISPTRPGLGISGRNVNEEISSRFGGIPEIGVYVAAVTPGGAAEVGGILPGDIITSFNNEPIFIFDELQRAISQREIDDIVEIRILRDGSTAITLEIKLRAFIQ